MNFSLKTSTTRFTNSSDATTLSVQMKKGKKAIKVVSRLRRPGFRVATGCRKEFAFGQDQVAFAEYSRLVADAKSKGWIVKPARVFKSAFSEIPAAPGFVAQEDEQESSESEDEEGEEQDEQESSDDEIPAPPPAEEPAATEQASAGANRGRGGRRK